MPLSAQEIDAILARWPLPPPELIEPLGNAGGFSGAQLWRLTIGPAQFCLRKWPNGTSIERVAAITRVLRHVEGYEPPIPFIPFPVVSVANRPFVTWGQTIWTLSPWMLGETVMHPSAEQLQNAMQALALFHDAVVDDPEFPRVERDFPAGMDVRTPPALAERLQRLATLDLAAIAKAEVPPGWDELSRRRREVLAFFEEFPVLTLLARFRGADQIRVALQICLRDVWSAHVLFTGDTVTGLIDFDAMRVDSIALDLARLIGSYAVADETLWEAGLEHYLWGAMGTRRMGLTGLERKLARLYDELAVILTPVQWLSWILLERRDFELAGVLPRIAASLLRLEHLRNRLRTGG